MPYAAANTHHLSIEDRLKEELAGLARTRGVPPGRLLGALLTEFVEQAPPPGAPQRVRNGAPTRVYIDDAVWRQVEQQARGKGISVSVLASNLVQDALDRERAA